MAARVPITLVDNNNLKCILALLIIIVNFETKDVTSKQNSFSETTKCS